MQHNWHVYSQCISLSWIHRIINVLQYKCTQFTLLQEKNSLLFQFKADPDLVYSFKAIDFQSTTIISISRSIHVSHHLGWLQLFRFLTCGNESYDTQLWSSMLHKTSPYQLSAHICVGVLGYHGFLYIFPYSRPHLCWNYTPIVAKKHQFTETVFRWKKWLIFLWLTQGCPNRTFSSLLLFLLDVLWRWNFVKPLHKYFAAPPGYWH